MVSYILTVIDYNLNYIVGGLTVYCGTYPCLAVPYRG